MADNTALNSGTGGDNIASKDVSGVKHQRVLNEALNAAGTPTDISPTNPMPIDVDTLRERVEFLETQLGRMLSGAGQQPHDGLGRTRVNLEVVPSAGVTVTQATAQTVGWYVAVTNTQAFNLPALMLRNKLEVS